jgi:D-alanyl-D-alanine carboxypeptidase (penicillin-binding protein 5/6)
MTSGTTKRPRYVVRRIVIGVALLVVVTAGVYTPVALLAPLPAATASVTVAPVPAAPAVALALPGVGSSAIALKGANEFLGSSGQTGPMPIASMTKILTSLVVLDAKPVAAGEDGPSITMTQQDADILAQTHAVDGSYADVVVGQSLSERQALEIMLLRSANNYAETITNWAFGSLDGYLAAAHDFTAKHGLSDTTVVDASGLNPGSQSSTKDLLSLANLALDNPVLAKIVATPADDFPELGTLKNSNVLLGVDGIDGIKTGTTDEAGSCLMFSADFAVADTSFTVVGVVQGAASSEDAQAAVLALLDSAKKGFTPVTLVKKGDEYGSYSTAWGDSAPIVATEDASTVIWSDTPVDATASTRTVTLAKDGEDIGDLDFRVAGKNVEVPLELDAELDDPGPLWRLLHPAELFG